MEHRDVDVLMLYPLDLVSVDERFGSWMTQFGYANLITPAKLLELGTAEGGTIRTAGRSFGSLVAQFEPFPSRTLISMMRELAEGCARVFCTAPPPLRRVATSIPRRAVPAASTPPSSAGFKPLSLIHI